MPKCRSPLIDSKATCHVCGNLIQNASPTSSGRSVTYDYKDGSLIQATDSQGHVDTYTYDDKGQMLTAGHRNGNPILINEYLKDGYIKRQTMSDGRGFAYAYARDGNFIHENQIMDPNGLETYIQYEGKGYIESLPIRPPFQRTGSLPNSRTNSLATVSSRR